MSNLRNRKPTCTICRSRFHNTADHDGVDRLHQQLAAEGRASLAPAQPPLTNEHCSCGYGPGDGINPACDDPNGCDYWRTGLQAGDSIDVAKYELVASAQYAGDDSTGEALVLHNHSTHFVVAVRPYDGEPADFDSSYAFGDNQQAAYKLALRRMADIALAR